jgi:CBS domain-containing protein
VGDCAVARFPGLDFFTLKTWGLRPRLYAVARFAGCPAPCFFFVLCAFVVNNTYTPSPTNQEARAMLIRDVIRNREPYSTRATATVQEAAEFMAERNIGAVCVVDENGRLLGVFSERDVLNRVVVARRDPNAVRVGDVTSELRAVIQCDETPHQALERMELIGSRHLPVVDGDRWVGMLSMRDLLRVEVGEQGDEIKLLHEYIQH